MSFSNLPKIIKGFYISTETLRGLEVSDIITKLFTFSHLEKHMKIDARHSRNQHQIQSFLNPDTYFVWHQFKATLGILSASMSLQLFIQSCGTPPGSPSSTKGTPKSDDLAVKRELIYPNSAILEKEMNTYLTGMFLENKLPGESIDTYSIAIATEDDVRHFNDHFKCKTDLSVRQASEPSAAMRTLADNLIQEIEERNTSRLQLIDNLNEASDSSHKRIILISGVTEDCPFSSAAFSLTDSDQFLSEESIFVPVGENLPHELSLDIAIDALSASVNRETLRVTRDNPEKTEATVTLDDSNRFIDSIASVLVTLDDTKLVSIAPISLALSETVPGLSDQALLTGIERIISMNLAVANNHQAQSSTPPQASPLNGIFSWFSGLLGGFGTGNSTGGSSTNPALTSALGLLTTSPELMLASALLQLFLNNANSPSTPVTLPTSLAAIPDYAKSLGLSAAVNLNDQIALLEQQLSYVEQNFKGRINESLRSFLVLSYSQGFKKRLVKIAVQE